ncbi:MAG: 16S rRNA (uracil(1498)-N(3))-methyltransferase [Pseudomonadales bacterium]|nr:16S rRNA (uracil(1498)-N(3))-methyltransferase [Pseudomonadales bacterium]
MRIPRVYTFQPLEVGSTVALEPPVSRYLMQSLRKTEGAQVEIFNGNGAQYFANIISSSKSAVTIRIESEDQVSRESPLSIHIGLAISKGDRMDYGIRKIIELGGNQITPLITQRCEVRLSKERSEKRLKHWRGIVISACEQCGRNRIPEVNEPVALDQWLASVDAQAKLIFQPGGNINLADRPRPESVALLVGPEGGFDDQEVVQAEQAGFDRVALGPRILRTETAPLAAISVLQYLWGDFDQAIVGVNETAD